MKPCCEGVAKEYTAIITSLKGGPQEGAQLYCPDCQLAIAYHNGQFSNPEPRDLGGSRGIA